jgi:hypothetical protein
MEISQKRNTASTRYVFHDDRLEYAFKDSSVSRNFSVPYTAISRDREGLTERNVWFRNVGWFWLGLGLLLLVVSWQEGKIGHGALWAVLGAGCLGAYYGYPTRYRILPSEKGNLLILDHDASADRIESEIVQRRAVQFRGEYDFFPDGESPQQLRNRFNWLHREGALSEEELQDRLARIEAGDQVADVAIQIPENRTLN